MLISKGLRNSRIPPNPNPNTTHIYVHSAARAAASGAAAAVCAGPPEPPITEEPPIMTEELSLVLREAGAAECAGDDAAMDGFWVFWGIQKFSFFGGPKK